MSIVTNLPLAADVDLAGATDSWLSLAIQRIKDEGGADPDAEVAAFNSSI